MLTASEVPESEVLVTFGLLVALQRVVAVLRQRRSRVGSLVDRERGMLYHRGEVNEGALRRHRLQLLGAARENGLGPLDQAEAVVLQSDGSFAVISPQQLGDGSALASVGR